MLQVALIRGIWATRSTTLGYGRVAAEAGWGARGAGPDTRLPPAPLHPPPCTHSAAAQAGNLRLSPPASLILALQLICLNMHLTPTVCLAGTRAPPSPSLGSETGLKTTAHGPSPARHLIFFVFFYSYLFFFFFSK